MRALINELMSIMRQKTIIEFFGSSLNTTSGILLESFNKKEKERNARINNLERELADIKIKLTERSAVSDSLLSSYQEIQNRLEKSTIISQMALF